MDDRRFDDLTRELATGIDRRRLLKGLVAVAFGGAFARFNQHPVVAACPPGQVSLRGQCVCKATGRPPVGGVCPCSNGQTYCANGCTNTARDAVNCGGCGVACPAERPYCVGGACVACKRATDCPSAAGPCTVAACVEGVCSNSPKPNGTPCTDANACTDTDTCQAGVCTPGTAVVCQPLDQCHESGVCDPATGQCSNPAKPNGVSCETGNRCTADTCQGGVCQQGPVTVICQAPNECRQAAGCDPATGLCGQVVNLSAGSLCGNAASCTNGVAHAQDTCNGAGVCVAGANTSCGAGETCVGTTCAPVTCLALQAACNPTDNQCCQVGALTTECEDVPGCGGGVQAQCCHNTGDSCVAACDCCDTDVCESNRCCHPQGAECSIFVAGECCEGFACEGGVCVENCLINGATCSSISALACCPGYECIGGEPPLFAGVCRPVCVNGARRCAAGGACCPADRTCCNGVCCPFGQHCISGVCGCLGLQAACDPNNNLCCQAELTFCPSDNLYGHNGECCRPQGGHCSSHSDCCFDVTDLTFGRDTCGDDGICGGADAYCDFDADCVDGRECIGACFGPGIGFQLCKVDGECPSGALCRQKRCIHRSELP